MSNTKPAIKLRKFPVNVAAWINQKDDKTWYSVKVTKSYRDKQTDELKDTQYLSTDDLPIAAELLMELWRRIAMKVEDNSEAARAAAAVQSKDDGVEVDPEEKKPF